MILFRSKASRFARQDSFHMDLSHSDEWQKAQRGEGYNGNVPELVAARARCVAAFDALNDSRDYSRRNQIRLWRE